MALVRGNTRMLSGVEFDRWENTYTTVQSSSASWASSSGLSGISYNRWAYTGSPPTSSFSIAGATSEIEESFRVTVDFFLQDPASYTISGENIVFSEAPPLSSNIVVVESYATASSISTQTIITESNTTRTLDLTDSHNWIHCTNASGCTITVPPQADVAWADGTVIYGDQGAAGAVTIAAGAGVTINCADTLVTDGQHSTFAIVRISSDVWLLAGRLVA